MAPACTIQATGSDAGTLDAGIQTVADQCALIGKEYCAQGAARCGIGLAYTLDQCIAAEAATCCTGSACSATSGSPPSAVTACEQAIDAEDCNSMANGAVPGACSGVPKMP